MEQLFGYPQKTFQNPLNQISNPQPLNIAQKNLNLFESMQEKKKTQRRIFKALIILSSIFISMYYIGQKFLFNKTKNFSMHIEGFENHQHLPTGEGMTRQHALHFYDVFMDILLNKHNRFPGHAENVLLLNYILRNDVKWRITESAIFRLFDVTGNDKISKKELDTFLELFPRISDKRLLDNFISVIDRNIDTNIVRSEWFNFCNKNLRPKLLQDLQEWENSQNLYLHNPKNLSVQYTAKIKEERTHRDLIHGQLDRALDMMSEDFMMFIDHWENKIPHTLDDPDMFVRRMGYWIINRFERWDAIYMWIYQILDDNGDGKLFPEEVKHQFEVFAVPIIHVKEIYYYLDENGDSVIEREEWHDWSETIRKLLQFYFKEREPSMIQYH